MRQFESIGHYSDFWGWLLLSAPDHFQPINGEQVDQVKALSEAFEDLRRGFHFAETRLKNERLSRIAREMVEMSYEAYSSGDDKRGTHILQECRGLIWKSRAGKIKYAVEAEQRAFGELVQFKEVHVSIYPYEGSSADLGPDLVELLGVADRFCRSYLPGYYKGLGVKHNGVAPCYAWAKAVDGHLFRVTTQPADDSHDAPAPLQKTLRGTHNRLRVLATEGRIRAYVVTQINAPGGDGLLFHRLERLSGPQINAVCLFKRLGLTVTFEEYRYHLNDPELFAPQADTDVSQTERDAKQT